MLSVTARRLDQLGEIAPATFATMDARPSVSMVFG